MAFSDRISPKTLVLFDVDGTLTPARRTISTQMAELLAELRKKVVVGFVGGSDLAKQKEQLGEHCVDAFDFCFSENGLTAYRLGESLKSQVIKQLLYYYYYYDDSLSLSITLLSLRVDHFVTNSHSLNS